MHALRYENNRLHVAETPMPQVDEREAIVRVTLAGICNTDLEITRGYADFEGTLGHEFVGVVEDCGLIGKRVVGEINVGCGVCALCSSGDTRHCLNRTVLGIVKRDGAFAEFLKLPAENLHVVPDEISDRRAVFTEPLAAACGIIERVPMLVEANDETRVAVIGDGKLGLLCAQALKALTRASVSLIGKHENKLHIAARRGIATMLIDEIETDKNLPRSFDCVVEATGATCGFKSALDLLRPRGVLVLKSTFHGASHFDAARIVVNEINIIGSRCGRFAPALELLRHNAIDVESLISDEFALTDGVRAFQRAGDKGVLKVLLKIDSLTH